MPMIPRARAMRMLTSKPWTEPLLVAGEGRQGMARAWHPGATFIVPLVGTLNSWINETLISEALPCPPQAATSMVRTAGNGNSDRPGRAF
jgi:hypothetical protein